MWKYLVWNKKIVESKKIAHILIKIFVENADKNSCWMFVNDTIMKLA